MIEDVLQLLKDTVNEHLSASSGWGTTQADHGQVVFLDSEKGESADFKLGAVTLLLVNLEQEHSLRPPDLHRRTLPDGTTQRIHPPVHLNAYVLFAARFKEYKQSLRYISLILQFFQTHRVLDHESTPALNPRIEKVLMELQTLPFSECYSLWSLLRASYQPSLLYKARMVVYQDEDGLVAPGVAEPIVRVSP